MKGANRNRTAPAPPPGVSHVAARSRTRATASLSFSDFEPNTELSESHRAAQFLDWAAKKMPLRNVPYVWITKHAYAKPGEKPPRPTDPDNETIRIRKMSQIKRVLWEVYKRRTVPSSRDEEPGVRATVDADDLAGTDYYRNKRRVANGIKRMADTRKNMDVDSIRDPGLKAMVESMDPFIKQLTKPDLIKQLELPPSSMIDDDDEDE